MSQYVTFRIHEGAYALPIELVQEINRPSDITPVPRAPAEIRGLVNLRGQIITIFDVPVWLGLGPISITDKTRNIIMKSKHQLKNGNSPEYESIEEPAGLLVDVIGDIQEFDDDSIEPPPGNVDGAIVKGVGKSKEGLFTILNVPNLIAAQK